MEYRSFGRLDWRGSALGFGCMRLPTTDRKPMSSKIDQDRAARMIRYAIDRGVNYIDTAYHYQQGKSEAFVGRVLTSGYRERVKLATKSPVWLIKKPKHFDKYLDEQLARLRTDRIDFYLCHALNKKVWEKTIVKHKLLDRAERAREDGKIVHLGFSFHDDFAAFKKIGDGHDRRDISQIQYNYTDTENQAGTKGLRYAASKSLGVVIMEPLLGGRLAHPPRHIKDIKKKYREMVPIPCTECSYCMPCPNGVDIPRNFEVYNNGYIHEDMRTARNTYERFVPKKNRASACAQCKRCERKCPQKIPISEWMPRVHAILSGGRISPKRTR